MGTGVAVADLEKITHTKMNLKLESVVNADVEAGAAIAWSKMAALASAHLLVGSAGGVATDVAVTGDISIDNAGLTAITALAVVNADVSATAAIAWSKMAALTAAHLLVGSAGGVATDVAITGDIAIDNAGVTAISALAVVNADVNAAAAIAWSKMAVLTTAHILIGVGNVATDVAQTGDVIISTAGVSAIQANVVVQNDIAATVLGRLILPLKQAGSALAGGVGYMPMAGDIVAVTFMNDSGAAFTVAAKIAVAAGDVKLSTATLADNTSERFTAGLTNNIGLAKGAAITLTTGTTAGTGDTVAIVEIEYQLNNVA